MDVIEMRELVAGYDGAPVAGPATLKVSKGEVLMIVGPNGAGKTTLLRTIAGLVEPQSGALTVRGRPHYIPQSDMLLPWKTIGENVILPLTLRGMSREEALRASREIVRILGLGPYLDKYPRHASGGTRRKAAVARGLVAGADIILLDEPFTGVDVASQAALLEALSSLSNRGITIVVVTHQIHLVSRIADRAILLLPYPTGVAREYPLSGLSREERYEVADEVVTDLSRYRGLSSR